jgi:hypothetical protein
MYRASTHIHITCPGKSISASSARGVWPNKYALHIDSRNRIPPRIAPHYWPMEVPRRPLTMKTNTLLPYQLEGGKLFGEWELEWLRSYKDYLSIKT